MFGHGWLAGRMLLKLQKEGRTWVPLKMALEYALTISAREAASTRIGGIIVHVFGQQALDSLCKPSLKEVHRAVGQMTVRGLIEVQRLDDYHFKPDEPDEPRIQVRVHPAALEDMHNAIMGISPRRRGHLKVVETNPPPEPM